MSSSIRQRRKRAMVPLLAGLHSAVVLSAMAQASPQPAVPAGHCQTLTVIERSFGHPMASHHPLALDPQHQQGRQVIVGLSNGLQLEFAEDIEDSLFFANFKVNNSVEVCRIPHRKPATYTIFDRLTGSFSEARSLPPLAPSPQGQPKGKP